MTENDDRNGFQNNQKTEKKMFEVGGKPGPGRGHSRRKREIKEVIDSLKAYSQNDDASLLDLELLDHVGRLILHDMISLDKKARLDSTKLFLNWLAKRLEAQERDKNERSFSPEEVSRFTELVKLRQDTDVAESTDEMNSLEED